MFFGVLEGHGDLFCVCSLSFSAYIHDSGSGWAKAAISGTIGWVVGGKIHSTRKEKKLNKKHKEEQKALYSQYYNDVYALQQQNAELAKALEGMGVRVKH